MKSKVLAYLSLILAIGAAVFMFKWGAGYAESDPETGKIVEGREGVDHPFPLVYVLFPLLGLLGIQKKSVRLLNAATIGMFLLVMLFFSVTGAVFLPSFFVLLVAALFYRKDMGEVSE